MVRYAAFIRDGLDRRRSRSAAAPDEDELDRLFRGEGARLRTAEAERWEAAGVLLAAAGAD